MEILEANGVQNSVPCSSLSNAYVFSQSILTWKFDKQQDCFSQSNYDLILDQTSTIHYSSIYTDSNKPYINNWKLQSVNIFKDAEVLSHHKLGNIILTA